MARKKITCIVAVILLLLYLFSALLPYLWHKEVSEEYRERYQPEDFYSEEQEGERVAYIRDNEEALLLRFQMIEQAENEIILSTFDFNADEAGKDVMAALYRAADRGVTVKIIVDGLSGLLDMKGNPWFQAMAAHDNISLKIYNKINLAKPWEAMARLHDKYLIIDEQMYLLGGRNTSNLFLGDYQRSQNIDQELFVYETGADGASSSLRQLQAYFQSVWELPESKDYVCRKQTAKVENAGKELTERYDRLSAQYPDAFTEPDWQSMTVAANRVTLLSNPIHVENKEPWMWHTLQKLMKSGKRVTIYTPYIICGKEMYEELTDVVQNTDSVEIITNDVSSGANPWGCTDYLNQKNRILKTGVRVHEFLGGHSNHTKGVLIDDRISVIGSYNLDMRSTYLDTELMLVVDCPELNTELRRQETEDLKWCRSISEEEKTYQYGSLYEPREVSFIKKVMYGLLRVIIIPIRNIL